MFKTILSDQAAVCAYSNDKGSKNEDAVTIMVVKQGGFSVEGAGADLN
ncbi:hypothetical protein [Undibacterium sp. TJN19]